MFTQVKRRLKDYKETIDRQVDNTLSFENICNRYEYVNPYVAQVSSTSLGLTIHDNVVLGKLISQMFSSSNPRIFTDDELKKYRFRPKWLALDHYGATDYWWIILAVNGYSSDLAFDDFYSLMLPNRDDIHRLIDDELFQKPIISETNSV